MSAASDEQLSNQDARYLYNHIIFPPRLPQAADNNVSGENQLIAAVIRSLETLLENFRDRTENRAISLCITAIFRLQSSRGVDGHASEQQLEELLKHVLTTKTSHIIPIEVKTQNAGLLVSKQGLHISFEAMELSPNNSAIMSSKGRLQRAFPDVTVKIPIATMQQNDFRTTLANSLAILMTQTAPGTVPLITKNGQEMEERRDTTDPLMISNWFMNFLAASGTVSGPDQIRKNTRDEVLWDNALAPWRRSPLWLLIKVTIQLIMRRQSTNAKDLQYLYKIFVLQVHADVLQAICALNFSSEDIHITNAKTSQRLFKLDGGSSLRVSSAQWMWSLQIIAKMSEAHSKISKHWTQLDRDRGTLSKMAVLRSLQPQEDLATHLPDLDALIQRLESDQSCGSPPPFQPPTHMPLLPPSSLPRAMPQGGENVQIRLAVFEAWVEHRLDTWLSGNLLSAKTPSDLGSLIKSYHATASSAYQDLPDALSVMHLTILELWCACDKSTSAQLPLLREFDHEVKIIELQGLLLPFRSQMVRLARIEEYVGSRSRDAHTTNPSIFRDFGQEDSFAVRYFGSSSQLQRLHSEIETEAASNRRRKCEELKAVKQRYTNLMRDYDESSGCDYKTVIVDQALNLTDCAHDDVSCKRCELKRQAEALQIEVYEWPLSSHMPSAQATVFELCPPSAFARWRDVTAYLITDVLGAKVPPLAQRYPQHHYTLDKHHELRGRLSSDYSTRRIVILSEVKPHLVTHRQKQVGVDNLLETHVCLENALKYHYFDSSLSIFTESCELTGELTQACSLQINGERASNLQKYISRPPRAPDGMFPNEVIAAPSDCPEHFSQDEYRSFASLSLGKSIIYHNILVQLNSPLLDFAKPETQTLLLQAIGQVGVSDQNGGTLRKTHKILEDEIFGTALLYRLRDALARITKNPETWRAAASFTAVTCRALSLTTSSSVRKLCLRLLETIRGVGLQWVLRLKERYAQATDDQQRTDFLSRTTEIALLCISTFDVDPEHMTALCSQESAVSTLLQCAALVYDNQSLVSSEARQLYDAMVYKSRQILYRSIDTVLDVIRQDNQCINDAVTASWAAFRADDVWTRCDSPAQQWIIASSGSIPVHVNLLNGQLLVNGLPLSRLPAQYSASASYSTLFGQSIIEVAPSNTPGMSFSATSRYRGYILHFGMDEFNLKLRAIKSGTVLDLLPSEAFAGILPQQLVTNYVHWYDRRQDKVLFSPTNDPWDIGADRWSLFREGDSWRLSCPDGHLINMYSPTATAIGDILSPLESTTFTHILLTETQELTVHLPRLRLSFDIGPERKKMHSRQYRGYAVDTDQSSGVLLGLKNKLVIVNRTGQRTMLVPVPRWASADPVQYKKAHSHTVVEVDREAADKVFAYHMDTVLRRVVFGENLQRALYLAYLHCLTAHCLPDPLTGVTGTESALQILQSAAVRSHTSLGPDDRSVLVLIGNLSPIMHFYPPNLMEMQRTSWNKHLPTLAQHPWLRKLADEILIDFSRMSFFQPERALEDPAIRNSSDHLNHRAAIRCSTFRVDGFGAEDFTADHDAVYLARGVQDQSRGVRSFITASMVLRAEAALHQPIVNLKQDFLLCFGSATIEGNDHADQLPPLRYDSAWLGSSQVMMKNYWCRLHATLHDGINLPSKTTVAAWLSSFAFAPSANMQIIQTLVATYSSALETPRLPHTRSLVLADGDEWGACAIQEILSNNAYPLGACRATCSPRRSNENSKQYSNRMRKEHAQNVQNAITGITSDLKRQWSMVAPAAISVPNEHSYINTRSAKPIIVAIMESWTRNRAFLAHLEQVSIDVQALPAISITEPIWPVSSAGLMRPMEAVLRMPKRDQIFGEVAPQLDRVSAEALDAMDILTAPMQGFVSNKDLVASDRVMELCQTLSLDVKSRCERQYVHDLLASCATLTASSRAQRYSAEISRLGELDIELLAENDRDCKETLEASSRSLSTTAMSSSLSQRIAFEINHAPRLTTTLWLKQLHREHFSQLDESWKLAVIQYGLSVTDVQRGDRLQGLTGRPGDLIEELRHTGHTNWDPMDHPETLLLEVENSILLRPEQEVIASHMRDPGNQSIAVQLLMGGGKSTTIVPAVVAHLTDQQRLARVVVARPQSRQMLQMLIAKLGGLLDRRIFHMPFCRDLRPSQHQAQSILSMLETCVQKRGILLVQPEHLLSLKLMTVEAISGGLECAPTLQNIQLYLDTHARDVVDECDENFSPKFELCYTMGGQQLIDLAPDRWLIIESVLTLLPRFAGIAKEEDPSAIEIEHGGRGRFPRIRLLKDEAATKIIDLIAEHIILTGVIDGLPSSNQPSDLQISLIEYISQTIPSDTAIRAVEEGHFWTGLTSGPLLLIRGLLAGGVLRFSLSKKRWRVNFGLDSNRRPETRLAVPYRSKDLPAARSEFSHPDVGIVLTLLSYYYGGLADNHLFDSFAHLLNSDQAALEYETWTSTASPSMPPTFRDLSGISLKDRQQCTEELFPHMRYSKNAIDYYLSTLVFPRLLKEFPHKLCASGWDIGATKTHPLTGFSGTNDTNPLLPLDVTHLNLPSQSHTNALVLQYLLQDETSIELLPCRDTASASADITTDADHVLTTVLNMQPEIRVLLDCGASILEQSNKEVVAAWLDRSDQSAVQAAIFFDDEELSVLDRSGRVETFEISPYAQQLDTCLVYLDEAHTRGTDLKLPRNYRAAVTLGQGLTKDKLTQGCMRMRKLGQGQSVAFVVPAEIQTKIRERLRKASDATIEVADVLRWSIGETWIDLVALMPIWAVQGERFERHKQIQLDSTTSLKERCTALLEPEAQTVETRSRPRKTAEPRATMESAWNTRNANVAKIVERCTQFDVLNLGAASLSEEQERELAPELEEQRQVERPAKLPAAIHYIHPDVTKLVKTGLLSVRSAAFRPAFQSLSTTSAAKQLPSGQFPINLLVTEDFARTVEQPQGLTPSSFNSDVYLRPAQWVLSVPAQTPRGTNDIAYLVIISPYEANKLMDIIAREVKVTLHLFSHRHNVRFLPLDKLELYNTGRVFDPDRVPRNLTMMLNLFAGTLYLRSYEEYTELCDMLGLLHGPARTDQRVQSDGFILGSKGGWDLTLSPVPFFRTLLMRIRHEGDGVTKTHLGRMLKGERLEPKDFVILAQE